MIKSSDGEERTTQVMMPDKNIPQLFEKDSMSKYYGDSIMVHYLTIIYIYIYIYIYPIECNDEKPNKENESQLLYDNNLKVKHGEKTTKEQDKNNETAKRNRPYKGQVKKQETR